MNTNLFPLQGANAPTASPSVAPTLSYSSSTSNTFTIGTYASPVTFVSTKGEKVTVDEMVDFMVAMKKRMLIIEPAFEKHEHYPALKAAYDHYLMIERMCLGDKE